MMVPFWWVMAAFAVGILLGMIAPRGGGPEGSLLRAGSNPRPPAGRKPQPPASPILHSRVVLHTEPFICDHCVQQNQIRDSYLAANLPPPPRRPTPPPLVHIREGWTWGQMGRECSHCRHVFY